MFAKTSISIVFFATVAITTCKCGPTLRAYSDFDESVTASNVVEAATKEVNSLSKLGGGNVIVDLLNEYRRMRQTHSSLAMQLIGTVGLVSGALKVEESMRENLYQMANALIDGFNVSSLKENADKVLAIEKTIERDRAVIEVLTCILEFARKSKTYEEFQADMQRISKEVQTFYWRKRFIRFRD